MSDTLPHDADAEVSVLGSMLLDNESIKDVLPIVDATDFYRGSHAILFRAMAEDYEDGRPVDAVLLRDRLRREGNLEAVGGSDAIANILDKVPTAAHAIHYADIVHEYAVKRRIIDAAKALGAAGSNGKSSAEVLADHHVRFEDLVRTSNTKDTLEVFSDGDLDSAEVPSAVSLVGPKVLCDQGFMLIVAEQGIGKTYLALELADTLSRGNGDKWLGLSTLAEPRSCLYLYGEGGKSQGKARRRQVRGGLPPSENLHLAFPKEWAVDLSTPAGLMEVGRYIERVKAKVVFIDPMTEWTTHAESKEEEAPRFLRGLNALRRRYGCAIVALHHTRKRTMVSEKGNIREARGHTSLPGVIDAGLVLDKEDGFNVRATWGKLRDAPRIEPVIARLDAGTTEEPGSFRFKIVSTVSQQIRGVDQVKDVLVQACEEGIEWMFKKQIMSSTGQSQRTVERYLARLMKLGQIECDSANGGVMARYRLKDPYGLDAALEPAGDPVRDDEKEGPKGPG